MKRGGAKTQYELRSIYFQKKSFCQMTK